MLYMTQSIQHDCKKHNGHVDIGYNSNKIYKNQVLGSSRDDWWKSKKRGHGIVACEPTQLCRCSSGASYIKRVYEYVLHTIKQDDCAAFTLIKEPNITMTTTGE